MASKNKDTTFVYIPPFIQLLFIISSVLLIGVILYISYYFLVTRNTYPTNQLKYHVPFTWDIKTTHYDDYKANNFQDYEYKITIISPSKKNVITIINLWGHNDDSAESWYKNSLKETYKTAGLKYNYTDLIGTQYFRDTLNGFEAYCKSNPQITFKGKADDIPQNIFTGGCLTLWKNNLYAINVRMGDPSNNKEVETTYKIIKSLYFK